MLVSPRERLPSLPSVGKTIQISIPGDLVVRFVKTDKSVGATTLFTVGGKKLRNFVSGDSVVRFVEGDKPVRAASPFTDPGKTQRVPISGDFVVRFVEVGSPWGRLPSVPSGGGNYATSNQGIW